MIILIVEAGLSAGIIAWIFLQCERAVKEQHRRGD
jgi:hypothetical protein